MGLISVEDRADLHIRDNWYCAILERGERLSLLCLQGTVTCCGLGDAVTMCFGDCGMRCKCFRVLRLKAATVVGYGDELERQ